MLKTGEALARRLHAAALVTGDSLGQVSSQTLTNITALDDAVTLPILRPLIGLDKTEIMAEARRIATLRISELPDQDCCSLLTPRQVETRARIEDLRRIEARLDADDLAEELAAAAQEHTPTALRRASPGAPLAVSRARRAAWRPVEPWPPAAGAPDDQEDPDGPAVPDGQVDPDHLPRPATTSRQCGSRCQAARCLADGQVDAGNPVLPDGGARRRTWSAARRCPTASWSRGSAPGRRRRPRSRGPRRSWSGSTRRSRDRCRIQVAGLSPPVTTGIQIPPAPSVANRSGCCTGQRRHEPLPAPAVPVRQHQVPVRPVRRGGARHPDVVRGHREDVARAGYWPGPRRRPARAAQVLPS